MVVSMVNYKDTGRRQKLRDSFVAGEIESRSEEAILEILLSYAIPKADLQPLSHKLINQFGDLSGVLSADFNELCNVNGIKSYSATLIKVFDWIRINYQIQGSKRSSLINKRAPKQQTILGSQQKIREEDDNYKGQIEKLSKKDVKRQGTGMFSQAVLKEGIEILPQLPDTENLEEIKQFIENNLHFSAVETRKRYSNYIISRLFLDGLADHALRSFAKNFAEGQELRDVCFYRFCKAEPLMFSIFEDIILPAIGNGQIERSRLRQYLTNRFPLSKNIKKGAKGIVEALNAGRIALSDRNKISCKYREISIPSFAFIVHSEFPEPGIYDIAKIEQNRSIRALLWNPNRVLPSLYELRNWGLIAKVSEIDTVRQFTTKYTLDQVVEKLVSDK